MSKAIKMNIPCEAIQVKNNQKELERFTGKKIEKYGENKDFYFSIGIGPLNQGKCLFQHNWILKYQDGELDFMTDNTFRSVANHIK